MSSHSDYKNAFIILAILFIAWGILGVMDFGNFTYSGYSTDGDNTIVEIEDPSPASTAGLQVGDKIVSIGGIAVEDSKARNRQNRPEIGETRTFVVDRNGAEESIDITYASQNSKDKMLNWIALLIGFLYVFFGVRAYLKGRSKVTLLFGLFALFFGFNFLNGPYFESHTIRNVVAAISFPFFLLSFAALLNFMLAYPKRRPLLDNTNNVRLIYAPAILLTLVIVPLIIFQPDSTSGLNTMVRMLFGVFILFYFGWSILAMIQNYSRASAEERSAYGLILMLWGTIIGLVPILIVVIINTAAPQIVIPGNDYVFLTLGLIPIAYGLALDKGATVSAEG